MTLATLHFPASGAGELWDFTIGDGPRHRIADARGEVTTDAPRVLLRVPREMQHDLSFLAALAPDSLDGLWLDRAEDAAQLRHVRHLSGLRALYLSYALVGGAALEHLGELANLEELDVCAAWSLGEHVEQLARLTRLTHLCVFETSFADADVAYLEPLTQLRVLDVGCTQLTDAGVARLAKLAPIEELDLTWNEALTDAACDSLAGMRSLRELRLHRTRVTPAALARLRAALPACAVAADTPPDGLR